LRYVPDARFAVGEEDSLPGPQAQGQRQILLSEVNGGAGTEPDRCHNGCIQSWQNRHEGSVYTATEHGPIGTTNVYATGFDHATRTDAHVRTANDVYAANDAPDATQYDTAYDEQSTS